jgi:chromosomal replication initiator protein
MEEKMTATAAEILNLLDAAEAKIETMRREIAEANQIPNARKLSATVEQVQKTVALSFGRGVEIMPAKARHARIAWPRQIAMALAYELTGLTMNEIGKRFGGRDHGTVFHAIKAVANRCETEPNAKELVEKLRRKLTQ